MSRLVRFLLEQITDLDLNLMQRFPRRELARALALLGRARHLHGPSASTVSGNLESNVSGDCLGGLEVKFKTAFTFTVTAGELRGSVFSPDSETRPGTWSGKVEPDDSSTPLVTLPIDTDVGPSGAVIVPLSQRELWVVSATDAGEVTVETASAILTLNTSTGGYDTTTKAKVKQRQFSLAVTRGPAGGGLPASWPGTALAFVEVPAGASDLSGATISDCRKLRVEAGQPNMVGGNWSCPLPAGWSSPSDVVWQGDVWARINGERLRVSCRQGLTRADLLEPGASWGSGAAIRWLYLCKVRAVVPRPVRKGNNVVGFGDSAADHYFANGALVLSPTPPNIGIFDSFGNTTGNFDLRPSATLTLPSSQSAGGGKLYAYAGETVPQDNALLVGIMIQSSVSGGLPNLLGPLYVGPDGWVTGGGLDSTYTDLLYTTAHDPTGTATVRVIATPQTIALTGGALAVPPFEGVRVSINGTVSDPECSILWRGPEGKVFKWCVESGSNHVFDHEAGRTFAPTSDVIEVARGQVTSSGSPTLASVSHHITALKLPYGSALVT